MSERELERYCTAMWQRHETRTQLARYLEPWPDRQAIHQLWPRLAEELIEAAYLADHADSTPRLVPWSEIDPPPPQHLGWREKYGDELRAHAHLEFALLAGPESVMRRAQIPGYRKGDPRSSGERDALRLWLNGDSYGAIASQLSRTMGRRVSIGTARTWVWRGKQRLRAWALREVEAEVAG